MESERVAQEQQQHIEQEGKRPMQSSKSIPETAESTPPPQQQQQQPLETTATNTTATSLSENEQPSEQDQKPPEQPMESFAAAVVPTTAIDDIGSRFYIKRQIIVGNVSKFIPPGKDHPSECG